MVTLRDVHVLGLAAQRRGEVALARVVDDGDDGGKLGVPAGQLEGGGDIAAARDAAEDPLVPGEPAGGLDALLGGGGDDPGQLGDVEIARHEAVADALDAVMPPRAGGEERALRGLDRVEAHGRIALTQVAPHSREEAARALGVDEGADLALHLLPHLGAGGQHVRLDVVGIVELPRHPVARRIRGADLPELAEGKIHVALAALGEDELGAVGAHDLLALLAHALGHDDGARIALDRRHPGAGDAGVARGAFEDAHARREIAPRLGALEHVEIDSVLEAARGAVPLDLDVERGRDVGGDAVQPDEGSASDGGGDGGQGVRVASPLGRRHRVGSLAFLARRGDPGPPRERSRSVYTSRVTRARSVAASGSAGRQPAGGTP